MEGWEWKYRERGAVAVEMARAGLRVRSDFILDTLNIYEKV